MGEWIGECVPGWKGGWVGEYVSVWMGEWMRALES